jgi:hypothetical protein
MKTLPLSVLALAALISAPFAQTQTLIKKVTLVVNFGEPFIIHDQAVQPFINMMNAMKTEKGFELTILQKTTAAAAKQTALNELKNQDVVLFANIGQNSFREASERALIEKFFTDGGRAIGFHATIDHHSYWPFWTDLHNGSGFQGHGTGTFTLDNDPEMAKIPALGKMWEDHKLGRATITASTEIYSLNVYPRGKEGVTVMQTLASPQQKREFTWHRDIEKGKYIFTCLGHSANDFVGDWLKKGIWGWMEYLKGKYEPTSALAPAQPKAFGIEHAAGVVTVNSKSGFTAQIRDVRGAVVLSSRGHDMARYSLAGFQPGIYFVKVRGAQGEKSQRVLVH